MPSSLAFPRNVPGLRRIANNPSGRSERPFKSKAIAVDLDLALMLATVIAST
jgi:hypothetical protein